MHVITHTDMMMMRRRFPFRVKRGLITINHCDTTSFATAASVTNQRAVFTTLDTPTNRGSELPTGSVLKYVEVRYWATDATPVTGRHDCMMLFQPGQTTYSDPRASWLDVSANLTEEAIQVRQNKMVDLHRQYIVTGAARPLQWVCRWRGSKSMRASDDIVVAINDQNATNWEGYCIAKYIT